MSFVLQYCFGMDKKTMRFYQIHFNPESKSNCFPESEYWKHYDNSNQLTEYFENSPIVDLIKKDTHKGCDYFGVFSHDASRHIHFAEQLGNDKLRFAPDTLKQVIEACPEVDVFAFEKRRKNDNIIVQAERYHAGFVRIIEMIIKEIGFMDKVPAKVDHIILFNHFVAQSQIYEAYVKEVLIPAMEVMDCMPELWADSGYIKTDNVHGKVMPKNWRQHFKQAFGVPYYPYHPFICERLPSLFVQKHKLNFKHIF